MGQRVPAFKSVRLFVHFVPSRLENKTLQNLLPATEFSSEISVEVLSKHVLCKKYQLHLV